MKQNKFFLGEICSDLVTGASTCVEHTNRGIQITRQFKLYQMRERKKNDDADALHLLVVASPSYGTRRRRLAGTPHLAFIK